VNLNEIRDAAAGAALGICREAGSVISWARPNGQVVYLYGLGGAVTREEADVLELGVSEIARKYTVPRQTGTITGGGTLDWPVDFEILDSEFTADGYTWTARSAKSDSLGAVWTLFAVRVNVTQVGA
jgi:hypothetical protein